MRRESDAKTAVNDVNMCPGSDGNRNLVVILGNIAVSLGVIADELTAIRCEKQKEGVPE